MHQRLRSDLGCTLIETSDQITSVRWPVPRPAGAGRAGERGGGGGPRGGHDDDRWQQFVGVKDQRKWDSCAARAHECPLPSAANCIFKAQYATILMFCCYYAHMLCSQWLLDSSCWLPMELKRTCTLYNPYLSFIIFISNPTFHILVPTTQKSPKT